MLAARDEEAQLPLLANLAASHDRQDEAAEARDYAARAMRLIAGGTRDVNGIAPLVRGLLAKLGDGGDGGEAATA